MSRARTKLAVLLVVTVATVALLRLVRRDASSTPAATDTADDAALIDGRFWIEGRPEKLTDYVHGAFFLSRANFGLFDRSSAFDVRLEMFDLTRTGTNLKIFFPQTEKETKTGFVVKHCTDKPPFDLCLDLDANPWGGPKRYYGFEKPEDERAALGPKLAERAARARELAAEHAASR